MKRFAVKVRRIVVVDYEVEIEVEGYCDQRDAVAQAWARIDGHTHVPPVLRTCSDETISVTEARR